MGWAFTGLCFTAAFSFLLGYGVRSVTVRRGQPAFWQVNLIPPLYGEAPRTGGPSDSRVTIAVERGIETIVVGRLDAREDSFGQDFLTLWAAAEEKCRDLNGVLR